MSKAQEPQRPLFPFGNPFRSISPKGSQLPQKLLLTLNAFEESLARRLKALEPKVADDVLTLSWLDTAMMSLCETHKDIKNLIAALDLPVCDWEEKWIDVYLDISVKLLDICIAFSSEISRLNQGRLLVQCGLYNLESHSSKQYIRSRSSLDGWKKQTTSMNPRIENCCSLLDSLMGSLDLPKVKNSAKGKVLMRAMYGVKVQTVFVCSVFHAALSGSTKKLVPINVADSFPWASPFTNLLTTVNNGIRIHLASGGAIICKELEAVDANVKKLYPMMQDGVDAGGEGGFHETVAQLSKNVETLSQGLDLLAKSVDGFFQIVLAGRDTLLCNLRANSTASDLKFEESRAVFCSRPCSQSDTAVHSWTSQLRINGGTHSLTLMEWLHRLLPENPPCQDVSYFDVFLFPNFACTAHQANQSCTCTLCRSCSLPESNNFMM